MNKFLFRIIVCLVPTVLSIVVVAWAYNQYLNGRGGFIPGVDLVGGTTLIYEVDESKMTPEAQAAFKIEALAEALKKRIDPADLYNVTIRPMPGTPPRVEIILPTGGKHQADVEREKWQSVLAQAAIEYPVEGKTDPYADVRHGDKGSLVDEIVKERRAVAARWVKNTWDQPKKKMTWTGLLAQAAEEFPPAESKEARSKEYADIPTGDTAALIARITNVERHKVNDWVEKKTDMGGGRRMLTGDEVENIKNLISRQGRLEFRILANGADDRGGDDREAIRAAKAYFEKAQKDPALRADLERRALRNDPPPQPQAEDGSLLFPNNLPNEPQHAYSWVEVGKSYLWTLGLNSEALQRNKMRLYDRNGREIANIEAALKTGQPFNIGSNLYYVRRIPDWSRRNIKDRQLGKELEFFVLVRDPVKGQEITGDYLVKANQGHDKGQRTIEFVFNSQGGERFYDVTTRNKPTGTEETGFARQLAIIFDGQVTSAPALRSPIRTHGQITGDFSQQEIDDALKILRAGALPATLKKDPVSEDSMGATLGATTIRWGTWSVLIAFAAVMAFMVFYYRFAGLVACVALLVNLLMTVAFMVLVQATFTLPGLAGLVLMLGMAVDANVLIYERLREERDRGASLSLALRNGYERAFPTILDTHLSSIFTAIVLYVVGNDQLKGFGISLTVGLIISLFTALYMTRTIFEVWLAKGWMKDLKFFDGLVKLIHIRYWDFMSIRQYWFTATIILTILGTASFIYRADSDPKRGKATVLNIDFTGGTLYAGRLNEPMTLSEVQSALDDKASPLPNLSVKVNNDLVTISTTERDRKKVLAFISDKLKDPATGQSKLKSLSLKSHAIETGKGGARGVRLVFADEKGQEAFAKPGAVQSELADAFVNVGLSPSAFTIERPSKRTMTWDDVLASAALSYPVPGVARPYADIKKDDRAALADAIYKKSVKPRLDAWFKENANTDIKVLREQAAKLFLSPDSYANADAKTLPGLVEKAERAGVEAWAKAIPLGEVEQDERYSELWVRMTEPVSPGQLNNILNAVAKKLETSPLPDRLVVYDGQLASDTRLRAFYAIVASWGAILLYLWFRFGNWTFGAAAVVCLIHDLLFTLGIIAACHYIHLAFGSWFLGIEDFKIDLQTVAALLTLVGYSVNDTIVVFDRIREVRGKNPLLTTQMINDSVNQTLTRTILASAAVMVVVVVLYAIGGEGVKLFAFVMIVGVIVGTYSSIYIASPLLLIFGEGQPASPAVQDRAAATAERG